MSEAATGPTFSRRRRSPHPWPLPWPTSSRERLTMSANMEGPPVQGNGFSRKTAVKPDPRAREKRIERVRILWENRGALVRAYICGFVLSLLVAINLPKAYEATAKLMPPESSSGGGTALLAALSA